MSITDNKLQLIKTLYYFAANTLIVLPLMVICAHLFLKWQTTSTIDTFAQHLSKERRAAYAHMTDADVNELINATWNPGIGGWVYDDWVGFKEAPRETRFVNVNEHGIRQNSRTHLSMSALDGSIWFFGGSTTFGYGVADNETIPANLEKVLKTRVVNFGRGYFYSEQENQLFKDYLKAGYRPKLVLFLDGVNERCDIEVYQAEMESLFDKATQYSWDLGDAVYPVTELSERVVSKLRSKLGRGDANSDSEEDLHQLSCHEYGKTFALKTVLRQNMEERQAICDHYSLKCVTFVQPFAGLHGIHADTKSYTAGDRKKLRDKFVHLESTWKEMDSIFVTDALDGLKKHAYVDDCHYSAEASEMIAGEISKKLREAAIDGGRSL